MAINRLNERAEGLDADISRHPGKGEKRIAKHQTPEKNDTIYYADRRT